MVQSTRSIPGFWRPNQPHPWPNTKLQWDAQMAMFEINKHADSLREWLFWKYGSGPTITVAWPVGWVVLHVFPDGSQTSAESADPNDHYRPWMEKNVGRQHRDWAWRCCDNNCAENKLTIKFRKSKAKWATMAAILWA
jgi:hypothetical protein